MFLFTCRTYFSGCLSDILVEGPLHEVVVGAVTLAVLEAKPCVIKLLLRIFSWVVDSVVVRAAVEDCG